MIVDPMTGSERQDAVDAALLRLAEKWEIEAVRPYAAADGVNLDPSDADRPTTWWVVDHPQHDAGLIAICGMMPVENGGQRLRGSWVSQPWRRRGLWWNMVEFRLKEAVKRGSTWVETYAVHPGPLLRRGWEIRSTKHRHGAVHVWMPLVLRRRMEAND
jgi:hypothetical protein